MSFSDDSIYHNNDEARLPVPLPPGFPAAPAEARTTVDICGHGVEIILRDNDESRLLARMAGFIDACHEMEEEDGEDEPGQYHLDLN